MVFLRAAALGRLESVMSIMTSSTRRTGDHFEPTDVDPQVQRRLRGYLEQIDYTAFASNKAVLGATLARVEGERFQRLAVAAATARAGHCKGRRRLDPAQPGANLRNLGIQRIQPVKQAAHAAICGL